MLPWRAAPTGTPASAGDAATSVRNPLPEAQQKLELRAMGWLARREYTRSELGRRLLRFLREQHRKAGLAMRAGDGSGASDGRTRWRDDGQAARAAALADEFAPPPAHPPAAFSETFAADDPHEAGDSSGAEDADVPAGFDVIAAQADVTCLLDRLEGQGVPSDARAAEMLVDARKSRRGLMRIQQELAQRGVSTEQAHEALAGLREQQVPLAREVWRKRFGTPPADAVERQKQTRFLASRGFSFDVIRQVLDLDEDPPD